MTTTPLPSTGAVSGLGETLAFFTQADFAQRRFQAYGDVFETKLLAQRMVFIRGEQAIADLMDQGEALEGIPLPQQVADGPFAADEHHPLGQQLGFEHIAVGLKAPQGEIRLGEEGQGFSQSAHGARAGEGGGGHRSSV